MDRILAVCRMAQESHASEQKSKSQSLVTAATTLFDGDTRRATKAAAIVVGGVAIGTLLYSAYKRLPSPHSSIPTAPQFHRLLGHVPFFKNNYEKMHDALSDLIGEYEIVALKLPDFYQIFLNTPKLCEWVFTTEFDKVWSLHSVAS